MRLLPQFSRCGISSLVWGVVVAGFDAEGIAVAVGHAFAIHELGAEWMGMISSSCWGRNGTEKRLDCICFFGQYDKVALAEGDKEVVYQAFKGPMVAGDHRLFVQNLCRDPELCKALKEAYIVPGSLFWRIERYRRGLMSWGV